MVEKHHFNEKEFDIEINFIDVIDSYGNYDIVRVTGSEGMATSDYMSQVVRDNYGRNQLQKRMEAFIENQQKQKK
jgi:transcriptional regulator GlxA family with amidase domain